MKRKSIISFIAIILVFSMTLCYGENVSFKVDIAGNNAEVTSDDLTGVDNSRLPVFVYKEIEDAPDIIFTGLLGEYDNGAWSNTDFSEIGFLMIMDWESKDIFCIVPQEEDLPASTTIPLTTNQITPQSVPIPGMTYSLNNVSVDVAFSNESGYVEGARNGNLSFEATLTNDSDADKGFAPIFSVYDETGKFENMYSADEVTVSTGQKKTTSISINCDLLSENSIVKAMVWDKQNLKPYINAQIAFRNTEDFYGNSIDEATYINDLSKNINGGLQSPDDTDFFKFIVPETGTYLFSAISLSDVTINLYHNNATSVLSGNDLDYELIAGDTYYIELSGDTGEYILSISDSPAIDFNIYNYDVDINETKKEIERISASYYNSNPELSMSIYNKYQDVVEKDLKLHDLPVILKDCPKGQSNYDELLNIYYKTKYDSFMELKQEYLSILIENDLATANINDEEMAQMLSLDTSVIESQAVQNEGNSTVANGLSISYSFEMGPQVFSTNITPSLTITSMTPTSITYSVMFPESDAKGNAMYMVDYNKSDGTASYGSMYLQNNQSPFIWVKSGIYTVSSLKPGGIYVFQMMWSGDGGNTYGGANNISRRIKLPYNTVEEISTYDGRCVSVSLEDSDKAIASSFDFNVWLNRLDKIYYALQDFTGYSPYNGRKVRYLSTRTDLSEQAGCVDGENYSEIVTCLKGNPYIVSDTLIKGVMKRLSDGDWGESFIEIIGDIFDKSCWDFDGQAIQKLYSYYLMEQLNGKMYSVNAAVYRSSLSSLGGDNGWYDNDEYYNCLKSDTSRSYDSSFVAKKRYLPDGMATLLIDVEKRIGWEPFRKTFRYFSSLSANQIPTSKGEKLKLFLTKLKDFSGQNVLACFNDNDTSVIEKKFGITLEYIQPQYPEISHNPGGEQVADIDTAGESSVVYKFCADESATYYIYTSPYGEVGATNDTYLEVYTNSALSGTPIAANDDYGGGRFSKVSISATAGKTYYIRVRSFAGGQLHTKLTITKEFPIQLLEVDKGQDIITDYGDYGLFEFTPEDTGKYMFTSLNYQNSTYETNTYLKLYDSEAMTNRIGNGSKAVTVVLEAGHSYYLQFSGYFMISAAARVMVQNCDLLQFKKRTDGNMIFVNSPEYITSEDMIDGDRGAEYAPKIFEQEEVTGHNTFYESHIAWYTQDERYKLYPTQDFYFDIDFYNPASTPVIITLKNLVYGTDCENLERNWGSYINGGNVIPNGQYATATIPPYTHLLLFDALGGSLCCHDPRIEGTYKNWRRSFGAFFDFDVSDGGNVTLSSLAAYNPSYLNISYGTQDIVATTSGNIQLDNGRVLMTYERDNERDINGKQKGYAKNQGGWIDMNIAAEINDSSYGAIPFAMKDLFYEYGIGGRQDYWMTSTSPLEDKNATPYLLPNSLHNYIYNADSIATGKLWYFDFRHKDLSPENINEDVNYPNANAEIEPEIIEYVKQAIAAGQTITSKPCENGLSLGEYGTTYHYTVTISNIGSSDRNVTFQISNTNGTVIGAKEIYETSYHLYSTMLYNEEQLAQRKAAGYTDDQIADMTEGLDYAEWLGSDDIYVSSFPREMTTFTIPAGSAKSFEIVTTIVPGAHGGLHNRLFVN